MPLAPWLSCSGMFLPPGSHLTCSSCCTCFFMKHASRSRRMTNTVLASSTHLLEIHLVQNRLNETLCYYWWVWAAKKKTEVWRKEKWMTPSVTHHHIFSLSKRKSKVRLTKSSLSVIFCSCFLGEQGSGTSEAQEKGLWSCFPAGEYVGKRRRNDREERLSVINAVPQWLDGLACSKHLFIFNLS